MTSRPPPTAGAAPAPGAVPALRAEITPPPSRLGAATLDDPWARLRRWLVRGQLTEAATRKGELGEASAASGRAGAEPVTAQERDRALQLLLEGIGSVLAGDGFGGARTLEELAAPTQANLSFRWLALHWSARAALKSGKFAAARLHVKEALTLAQQLDIEARAVSQWTAAEVLAHEGDHARALAWLGEARARFERVGERWGVAQTWLAEARVLVTVGRDAEALNAARQAGAVDPASDEPPIFLARRAVVQGELAEAEAILRPMQGQAAERVRGVIAAIRERAVSQADASEYLREADAPTSAHAIQVLERIAAAAPGFVPAREALAWMLLKVGKYAEAGAILRALLGQQLGPADRASVMLGLGCIAHAQQTGKQPDARLRAAVNGIGGVMAAEPEALDDGVVQMLPRVAASPAARSSAVVGGSVFSGQLNVFALPDVLEFLRSARRTGLLVCSSEKGMAELRFRDGFIAGASAAGTPALGDLLLESRKISIVALRSVSPRPGEPPDHVLADALVKEGLVEGEAVEAALEEQVERTLRELVTWKDGEFAFNRDEDDAGPQGTVRVDVQGALLNVFRQMDEDARGPAAVAEAKR